MEEKRQRMAKQTVDKTVEATDGVLSVIGNIFSGKVGKTAKLLQELLRLFSD